MARCGEVAVSATHMIQEKIVDSPRDAWTKVVTDIFSNSESSQKKGCPKDTYLSLCADGRVVKVPSGSYTRSVKNRQYALEAINLLYKEPSLANDEKLLWHKAVHGEDKVPNHQMEVVLALWNNGLIQRTVD